jgi:hypothetical protein
MSNEKDLSGLAQSIGKNTIPVKGERLTCETCGLSVIIDEVAGSIEFEAPLCCSKPMKLTRSVNKKQSTAMKTRGRQAGSSRYQS